MQETGQKISSDVLQLERVCRDFDHRHAIENVSIRMEPGRVLGILGPNGAGKTTLMRLIAGWTPVSSGVIRIGDDVIKPSRELARQRVFLVDEPQPNDTPAIYEIIQPIADYKIDRFDLENEVASWMERFQLVGTYDKTRKNLSRGQRYRMRLIGLFVCRPHVWLLDEPFSCGLDADGLLIMEQQMREHADRGGIVAFSTQWPEHAVRLADDALVLDEGRLVHGGPVGTAPTSEVIEDASSSLRAVLEGLS